MLLRQPTRVPQPECFTKVDAGARGAHGFRAGGVDGFGSVGVGFAAHVVNEEFERAPYFGAEVG